MLFGMPAAYTLTSWVNMGRSSGTWEGAQERRPWGPGFMCVDSILGPHFEKKVGTFDINMFFCFMFVSKSFFLMIIVSESGRLGLKKQAFCVRGVAKTSFTQKSEFC